MSAECRIRVLPDLLVKKIAAGEVVERPASVVKELLENAVDAGAGRVAVTIEDGGKRLIQVADDGFGMSAEELRLAVAPHATSKLRDESDLYAIGSMGFRGEALASISSVSKLRIVSRPRDQVEGHDIRVLGEEVASARAAGCPPGTTVEVRDLFFNVPARRKFLRATSTEVGQINEQITRIGLAYPSLALEVTNNGRLTQRLPAVDTRLERIGKFFGPELASALLAVEREEAGLKLEAYAAPPSLSRATPQWQYTFVNGRYIRDRNIQHAIKESYRGLMEPNRHGVVFLLITVDPEFVDVNVHPTKIEVRWADARLVYSQVLSALREAFQVADLTPAYRARSAGEPVSAEEQERVRREMAELLRTATPIRPGASDDPGPQYAPAPAPWRGERGSSGGAAGSSYGAAGGDPLESWRRLYGQHDDERGGAKWEEAAAASDVRSADALALAAVAAPGRRAVQMHNLYLVAETDDGIVIVDQHALHERVLYEQFRDRLAMPGAEGLESQRLLLPETVKVTSEQAALLEEHASLLVRVGIEVTPFGTDCVAVQSFPALLKDTDVASFMRDLIDFLAEQSGDTEPEVVIDRALSLMACKAAVKAGDPLTPEEIDALFSRRDVLEKPSSCPHGRPTMLRLSKADLDRQFHRT